MDDLLHIITDQSADYATLKKSMRITQSLIHYSNNQGQRRERNMMSSSNNNDKKIFKIYLSIICRRQDMEGIEPFNICKLVYISI